MVRMCGTMPHILYAFMSCIETALIAIITCKCVSCSNRQDRISNMYCTCNCAYPPLRCDTVYSGKNLTYRRNILPQSSGCSGDEGNRCLRNVGKSLAGHVIPRQAAFFVVSTIENALLSLGFCLPHWPCSFITNIRNDISKLFAVPTNPKLYSLGFDNFNRWMSKLRVIKLNYTNTSCHTVRICILTTECTSASAFCRMCIVLVGQKTN
jgi:hypothetical protein